MTDPLFWLVLSLLFVTASLTIALVVAIPTLRELGRAARSAEKLFDTLRREFPPTLEAIRLTGLEISDLTDDLSEGVQSAGQVVKQVDQTLSGARKQARKVQLGTRGFVAGIRTAWKTFSRPQPPRRSDRLPVTRSGGNSLEPSRERSNPRRLLSEERSYAQESYAQELSESVPQPPAHQSSEDGNGAHFISKSGEVVETPSLLPENEHPAISPSETGSPPEDSYRER